MTEPNENPLKYQVGGDHYRRLKYQPIQLIHDLNLDFDRANCIKYVARLGHKGNPIEDIQKIRQYLKFYEEKQKPKAEKLTQFIHQFHSFKILNFIHSLIYGDIAMAEFYLDQIEAKIREEKSHELSEVQNENEGLFD